MVKYPAGGRGGEEEREGGEKTARRKGSNAGLYALLSMALFFLGISLFPSLSYVITPSLEKYFTSKWMLFIFLGSVSLLLIALSRLIRRR